MIHQKRGGTLRGLRINREILILRKPLIEVEYHTPTRKYWLWSEHIIYYSNHPHIPHRRSVPRPTLVATLPVINLIWFVPGLLIGAVLAVLDGLDINGSLSPLCQSQVVTSPDGKWDSSLARYANNLVCSSLVLFSPPACRQWFVNIIISPGYTVISLIHCAL